MTTLLGSHTKFVPEIDVAKGLKWNRLATLGHELKHGYNLSFGQTNNLKLPGTINENIKYEEADAVNFQNLIHKRMGITPRIMYGDYNLLENKFIREPGVYKIKPSENNYPK